MKKILLLLFLFAFLGEAIAQIPIPLETPITSERKMFPGEVVLFHDDDNWWYLFEERIGHHQVVKYPKGDSDGVYFESQKTIVAMLPNKSGLNNWISRFAYYGENSFLVKDNIFYFFASTGYGTPGNQTRGRELGSINLLTHEYNQSFINLHSGTWRSMYEYNGRIYALAQMSTSFGSIALNGQTMLVANDSTLGNDRSQFALVSFVAGDISTAQLEYHFKDENYVDKYILSRSNLHNNGSGKVVLQVYKEGFDTTSATQHEIESFLIHFDLETNTILSTKQTVGHVGFLYTSSNHFVVAQNLDYVDGEYVTIDRITKYDQDWNIVESHDKSYGYTDGAVNQPEIVTIKDFGDQYFFVEGDASDLKEYSYNYFFTDTNLKRTISRPMLEPDITNSISPRFERKRIWNMSENGFNVSYQIKGADGDSFADPAYFINGGDLVQLGGQSIECPAPANYMTDYPNGFELNANRRTVTVYYEFSDISDKVLELDIADNETVYMNSKFVNGQIVEGDDLDIVLVSDQDFTLGDNIPFSYFEGSQSSGWNVIYGQPFQYPYLLGHPNEFGYANVQERDGVKFVDIFFTQYPESAELRGALVYQYFVNSKTYRIYLVPPSSLSVNDNELVGVSVYPNPSFDSVTIKGVSGDVSLELFTIQGQKVFDEKMLAVNNSIKINLNTFDSGMYLLNIVTDFGSKKLKLVKR